MGERETAKRNWRLPNTAHFGGVTGGLPSRGRLGGRSFGGAPGAGWKGTGQRCQLWSYLRELLPVRPRQHQRWPPEIPEPDRDGPALIAAKQAAALEEYRQIRDQQQPMFQTNEMVELRLITGRIIRGEWLHYSGGRTNRSAVIATEQGKQLIEVKPVDLQTRLRMDDFVRENYAEKTRHVPIALPKRITT